MLLVTLKILTTLLTTILGVFAVNTDFKDKKTDKLTNSGRWYIVLFVLSAALTFIFTDLSDEQSKRETDKRFSHTISQVDILLKKTEGSLNSQFISLNKLNNTVDSNIKALAINTQKQLDSASYSQKQISKTTSEINSATTKTVKTLDETVSSLVNLDHNQRQSLATIVGISEMTSENLGATRLVFAKINTLNAKFAFSDLNIRHIKVETLSLMNSATESYSDHAEEIKEFFSAVNKIQEDKSFEGNEAMTKVLQMFADTTRHGIGGFMTRWKNEGKLSKAFVMEMMKIIGDGFDVLIAMDARKQKSWPW